MAAARRGIDVLFLGDAVAEQWMGTRLRFPIGHKAAFPDVFNSLFTLEGGGRFEGLALGISGDTVSQIGTAMHFCFLILLI